MNLKKIFFVVSALVMILFSGCAKGGYTQANVGEMSTVHKGVVISSRYVRVQDDGGGSLLGAIVGGMAGNSLGNGNGLATVGGAVAGSAVGSALNEDDGQEVLVKLSDGREVRSVIRTTEEHRLQFRKGDKVRVFVRGSRVTSIELM